MYQLTRLAAFYSALRRVARKKGQSEQSIRQLVYAEVPDMREATEVWSPWHQDSAQAVHNLVSNHYLTLCEFQSSSAIGLEVGFRLPSGLFTAGVLMMRWSHTSYGLGGMTALPYCWESAGHGSRMIEVRADGPDDAPSPLGGKLSELRAVAPGRDGAVPLAIEAVDLLCHVEPLIIGWTTSDEFPPVFSVGQTARETITRVIWTKRAHDLFWSPGRKRIEVPL